MSTTIKAIETVYNGYRFRSRLEARWARFFDVLGIRYEYEKEGYDLGSDGWYLPDFWLPDLSLWYEVKGELEQEARPSYGAHTRYVYPEWERLMRFADLTGWPIVCASGPVGDHVLRFYAWDVTDSSGGSFESDEARWCYSNGMFTINPKPGMRERAFISDNLMGVEMPQFTYPSEFGSSYDELDRGYIAARSARFEHGERG